MQMACVLSGRQCTKAVGCVQRQCLVVDMNLLSNEAYFEALELLAHH